MVGVPGTSHHEGFVALWEQCGFLRAGHSEEEAQQRTREGCCSAPVMTRPLKGGARRTRMRRSWTCRRFR